MSDDNDKDDKLTPRHVLQEAKSLLRASDTFKLITTEGPGRLESRAAEQEGSIANVRGGLDGEHRSPFDELVRPAKVEIAAQRRLADWLRQLGKGGDA